MPTAPLLLYLSLLSSPQPPASRAVAGCWDISPALGPSASPGPVAADSAFRTVLLHAHGGVGLPKLPEREARLWAERSRWSRQGDQLEVVLFTGLQGWRARLTRRGASERGASERSATEWAGTAIYLTDVIVRGAALIERAVVLRAVRCEPAWTARASVAPDSPFGQPYFAFQVERPARLVSARPRFANTFRPLGQTESLDDQPPRSVGVQFVITESGRIAMGTAKLLGPQAQELEGLGRGLTRDELFRALRSMRFAPAHVGGKAVPVLEQYLLMW